MYIMYTYEEKVLCSSRNRGVIVHGHRLTVYEPVHSTLAKASFSEQLTIIFLTWGVTVLTKATHSRLRMFKQIKKFSRNIIGIVEPIRIRKRLIFRFLPTLLVAHNQELLAIIWAMRH